MLDILGLAHKYGFNELEISISEYLKVCSNCFSLVEFCHGFSDSHSGTFVALVHYFIICMTSGCAERA